MNIAIITGGTDDERSVSIRSAENISKNINFAEVKIFLYPEQWQGFIDEKEDFDIIVPMIHGAGGEDGTVQEQLELLSIPYIFSKPESHKICYNKEGTKKYLINTNIKYPKNYAHDEMLSGVGITYPIIAKPRLGGSSIGLYVLENHVDFLKYNFGKEYLFEEYITGREFTIGIVDYTNRVQVLPIMEAQKKSLVFNFDQKYSEQADTIEIFPENLNSELTFQLQKTALFIHKHFNLNDVSRTDVIVDSLGEIYFLEVNTIPGMTEKSWIPKMLAGAGIPFSELLEYWIKKV